MLAPGAGATAKVEPGPGGVRRRHRRRRRSPASSTATSPGATRAARCTSARAAQNTKRVTVAVTLDPRRAPAPRPPVWVSTIVVDPDDRSARGAGTARGRARRRRRRSPPTRSTSTTPPAGRASRQPQTGSHPTRNTASTGAAAADNSTCEHPSPDHAAGPDGRLRAPRRQQHPCLRVLVRPGRRLPRRSCDGRTRAASCAHSYPGSRRREPAGAQQVERACVEHRADAAGLPSRRSGDAVALHLHARRRLGQRAPVRDAGGPRRRGRRADRPCARLRRLRPRPAGR